MVSFAAQEPDVNPANTAFWARPIREPKVDISGETLGRTIGGAVGEGLKFADEYMKEGIVAPTVDTEAGKLRDQFVDALNVARNQVEPQPLGAPKSLTPEQQADLPKQVQTVGDKVDMLQKAMESGKLSETDYYGRVNAMAKQLRAQFPGYRDTVDAQIAKVTGVHPANQYVRGMIGDLNRLITQHGQTKDRFEANMEYLEHNGLVTADESRNLRAQHNAGKLNEDDLGAITAGRAFNKADAERRKNDWAVEDRDAKQGAIHAEQDITHMATTAVSNILENEKITDGTYKGQKAQDVIEAYNRGDIKISDEDWHYLAAASDSQYQLLRQELIKRANQPFKDANGVTASLADRLRRGGEKTVDQVIDASLSDLKARTEYAGSKNFSMHQFSKELVEARTNDRENLATKDPYVASTVAMANLVRKNLGEQAFSQWINSHQKDAEQLDKTVTHLFNQDALAAIAQPRKVEGGAAYEFTRNIEDAKNKGIDSPEFYQGLLHGAELITNKDTDQVSRANLIDYFFGPNSGTLTSVATKGQINAFSALYTPDMARAIMKYNPDKYEMFLQGAEQNARTLFTSDINALKALTTHEGPGAMQVDWVHDHFEPRGVRPPPSGVEAIKRINLMIHSMEGVYQYAPGEHTDIETFMFGRLMEMGFTPEERTVHNIPEQIMKTLLAAKQAGKAPQLAPGALKSPGGTETP